MWDKIADTWYFCPIGQNTSITHHKKTVSANSYSSVWQNNTYYVLFSPQFLYVCFFLKDDSVNHVKRHNLKMDLTDTNNLCMGEAFFATYEV